MGKKSLLKSTSKKSSKDKAEKEQKEKTTAPKKKAAAKKAAVPKKKPAVKKASEPKKKAGSKKAAPKKAVPKKADPQKASSKKAVSKKADAPGKKPAAKKSAEPKIKADARKTAAPEKKAPVKKSAAPEKKAPAKKSAAPSKKAPAKKVAEPKKMTDSKKAAAQKKKADSRKKAASKKAVVAKKITQKVPPKKKLSQRELLSLKFDAKQPEKLHVPKASAPGEYTAPVFADRPSVKRLLLEKIDIKKFPAKRIIRLTVPELLALKFETSAPEKLYVPPVGSSSDANYTAPAFFADNSPVSKELLLEKFDINEFPEQRIQIPDEPSPGYVPPHRPREVRAEPRDYGQVFVKLLAVGGFTLLMFALLYSSFSSMNSYYIEQTREGINIYKGSFDPMGKTLEFSLFGAKTTKKIKKSYSRAEAYTFAFNYYMDISNILIAKPGVPDFNMVRKNLINARPLALLPGQQLIINRRLLDIDLMVLLFKTDIALEGSRPEGLELAMDHLEAAAALKLDELQRELVEKRIELLSARMASLEPEVLEVHKNGTNGDNGVNNGDNAVSADNGNNEVSKASEKK